MVARKRVDHDGHDPGRDEEGDGVDGEDAERVDLLGDDHGPELGRVVGADAAVDHQRRQERRDLAQRAEARAPAEQAVGAEALHQGRGLEHHDDAGEEGGDDHDRDRLHPHAVEVPHHLGAVEPQREDAPRHPAREQPHPPDHLGDLQEIRARDADERRRGRRGAGRLRRSGLDGRRARGGRHGRGELSLKACAGAGRAPWRTANPPRGVHAELTLLSQTVFPFAWHPEKCDSVAGRARGVRLPAAAGPLGRPPLRRAPTPLEPRPSQADEGACPETSAAQREGS